MRRRDFMAGLVGAAAIWPGKALAQSTKMLRVGTASPLPRTVPFWVAFEQKLAALGYQEGKNVTFDYVQTSGFEGSDPGYREIVARKPDILVASGPEQNLKSARAATDTLPIVMIAVDYDPISRGHVTNLARPAGNITGIYFQSTELAGKRLQLMKEAVPGMDAATVVWDRAAADNWAAMQAAAPHLGVRLTGVEFRERPYDYERIIADVAPANRTALIAGGSPFFFQDRAILAEFALRHRTPIMLNNRDAVIAGALMAYAASLTEMHELAATYVDRIAKGAAPADLPVQQPTKFELLLNLKTARTLGLTISQALLAQADEVIE
jgi:putative tryptophan/tyrosine transport system substrate-binding protein